MLPNMFNNRDLSWLSFNHRVLEEAANHAVPLLERIKFLAIFSSNLDEFYRVRFPAILALHKLNAEKDSVYEKVTGYVKQLQLRFGHILDDNIIPALSEHHIQFLNIKPIPAFLNPDIRAIFYNEIAGFIQPVFISSGNFFPESNRLYTLVVVEKAGLEKKLAVVNIPSGTLPRFYKVEYKKDVYIIFLEDIIKAHLSEIFQGFHIVSTCNFKITRDAELHLNDDFDEDIATKIEKKIQKRDYGLATRFLYQPGIEPNYLDKFMEMLHLHKASAVSGGVHHAFKDMLQFPFSNPALLYTPQLPIKVALHKEKLLDDLYSRDIMIHTPYHDYNIVLRFFNELALSAEIETIFTTFYRVAADSKIAQALISAAKNGKKVYVLVELKARFDEENNLRWSKRMKDAGIKIIYSNQHIKVHAKIALAKTIHADKPYVGLLATGNLNENTAKVYTDHVLLTTHTPMLTELYKLFLFLLQKQKPDQSDNISFKHLLVAQFNLQSRFFTLIEREIANHKKGLPAAIRIKLNNLEEALLIKKLYKASKAGVKVELIVRGICCLRPGVKGLSEHIKVKRIVDRYLEHGRIFIFHNGGSPEVFAGSSDWMIRNIYRRIEVCFPVYDISIKQELIHLVDMQWQDDVKGGWIGENGENLYQKQAGKKISSQQAIYALLKRSTG